MGTVGFSGLGIVATPFVAEKSGFCCKLNRVVRDRLSFLGTAILSGSARPIAVFDSVPVTRVTGSPSFPGG